MDMNVESNTKSNTQKNIEFIEPKAQWLINFVENYKKLSIDNLVLLENIYHNDITFIDPLHEVQGFDNLKQYFYSLYNNLTSCSFNIENVFESNNEAAIYWSMLYQHPKLNAGKTVVVQGHSHIKGMNDKVIYHRDYLDAGAMLYEQLPIIGKIIQCIKSRAVK